MSELKSLYTDNELEITEDNNYLIIAKISDDEDNDKLNNFLNKYILISK